MDVDFLPPHLIILGGSYIGLEFAQIYRRFGSEVSVIELAPHLIAREDEDVSLAVEDILQGEGIQLYVNSRVVGVAREGNGIAVQVVRDGVASQIAGSHLLMAIGRRPNTDDLGLETAGIAMDSAASSRWTTSCVRACREFGPWETATAEAPLLIRPTTTLRSSRPISSITSSAGSDRIPAYALYTDPPLGRVGMSRQRFAKRGAPPWSAQLR